MEPNWRLREAREATFSPRLPGASLSRQELAEAVNAWCAEHSRAGLLDAHYIGRLEQGRVGCPRRVYRAAFRHVLNRTDAELGWGDGTASSGYSREGGEEDEEMRRRAFLTAASAALFARPDVRGAVATPDTDALPSRIGAADVAALRDVTAHLRAVAHAHDGYAGMLAPAVSRAERLLDVPAIDATRQGLLSVAGELHRMAGWLAYDACGQDACRAHLRRSMELCSAADDAYGAVWACVLAGTETDEDGHPADALRLFRMAQGRLASAALDDPRRCDYTARLHGDVARALAGVGDHAEARSELAAALHTNGGDAEGLAYQSALVQRLWGDLDAAEAHLQQATRPRGSGPDRRAPMFSRIMLADVHVAAGDSSGAPLAEQVIREVEATRSVRVRRWLSGLAATLDGRGERELAHAARSI